MSLYLSYFWTVVQWNEPKALESEVIHLMAVVSLGPDWQLRQRRGHTI